MDLFMLINILKSLVSKNKIEIHIVDNLSDCASVWETELPFLFSEKETLQRKIAGNPQGLLNQAKEQSQST